MSALSAGEPDECSVDVSLQTDKTRHCTTTWRKKKTEPVNIIKFIRSDVLRHPNPLSLQFFDLILFVSGLIVGARPGLS